MTGDLVVLVIAMTRLGLPRAAGEFEGEEPPQD
jgi:hypothetical protein